MKRMNNPHSIIFITGQLGLGGAEKQLYLLVRGLVEAGWKVSVITLNPGKEDYWEMPLRELGIAFHGVAPSIPRYRRLLNIQNILRQTHALIVHSWTIHANFYAATAGRLAGAKVRLGSERANQNSSRRALGQWAYDLNLWGLDGIVVNSQPAADFLGRYRPRLKVWVVPNGLEDPKRFKTQSDCRAYLNIPSSVPVIGAVGSLVPRKNIKNLIAAIKLLSERGLFAFLVVIGTGPLLSDLEDQARRVLPPEGFLFKGALPEAAQWLPAFDVFCLPSNDQEGMPNVLMEASAAGLPIVATDVGAVPDIVENGKTGLLVPADDVMELANALEILLRNPEQCRRLGQAGREKMLTQYSVKQMVESMLNTYNKLL
jgi:L-malate glycosyltransferase